MEQKKKGYNLATQKNNCPMCLSRKVDFLIEKYDDRYGQSDLFKYFICNDCGIVFLVNKIGKEDLNELYAKYYKFGSTKKTNIKLLSRVLHRIIPSTIFSVLSRDIDLIEMVDVKDRVLEIGPASNISYLRKVKRSGLNWMALEVNKNCVKSILANNLQVYHGSIDSFLAEEKFDVIIMSQSIEHQYDLNEFFKQCKNILTRKGRIIFTTPNFDSRYRNIYKSKWINWHAPYHNFLLSKRSIKNICNKFNYEMVKFFTYTPTSWFFLQKQFTVPRRGEKNKNFNFNFPLFKQLFVSIYLRLLELRGATNGDCIYCEIKLKE